MNRYLKALARVAACALFMALCTIAAAAEPADVKEEKVIFIASDLHVLSPSLTDYGERFMQIIESADGKVTHYSPQIAQAFVAQALEARPDAIVLSGDLTLNGAPQSHSDLVNILRPLRDAGIPVLVMPGNHDVGPLAYRFGPDGASFILGTSAAQFAEFYADFGYADALSRDSASLSYCAQLFPGCRAILIDVNANEEPGAVAQKTLLWVEEQLIEAKRAGETVIGVTHQNLMAHSTLIQSGFVIDNAQALQSLFERYGVTLNLSGHMHMQHVIKQEGITEIATGSLAVSPNAYGVLTLDADGPVLYQRVPVDVRAWATQNGETNPDLLDFAAYSRRFFEQTTRRQVTAQLSGSAIDEEDRKRMIDFAVRFNWEYFAGAVEEIDEETLALFDALLPDAFFTLYLNSIAKEAPYDMNTVRF